jgi:hypothetical protein
LSKKEKNKNKDKDKKQKKLLLKSLLVTTDCKKDCCEKYKKSEHKRCKKCPMFDVFKKLNKLKSLHN